MHHISVLISVQDGSNNNGRKTAVSVETSSNDLGTALDKAIRFLNVERTEQPSDPYILTAEDKEALEALHSGRAVLTFRPGRASN